MQVIRNVLFRMQSTISLTTRHKMITTLCGEILRDRLDRQTRISWRLPKLWILERWKRQLHYTRPIQSNSSAIELKLTPIVRLPNSFEHNRTHNKILPIEHNRTFYYRTIGNRTQSNVRLPNDWYNRTFD